MSDSKKVIKIVGVIAAVVLIGIGIGLWGSGGTSGRRNPDPETNNPSLPSVRAAGETPNKTPVIRTPAPSVSALPASNAGVTQIMVITNWEERVDHILGTEEPEPAKAKQMLDMFPNLPTDAKAEVAQHLANLTEDQNYASLTPLLTDPTLSEEVLEVFMADLLNRPNSIKLPLMLEIAKIETHPNATEAVELLQLFLEEDHGKDWAKWQSQLQVWLQDNPD